MVKSIISSKVEVRGSNINNRGTFAIENIARGEVVFIKGGYILTKETMWTNKLGDTYWPIDNFYVLAPRNEEEAREIKLYINHSCEPNCGLRGDITGVAMRDIQVGEEITFDYAMLDNESDPSYNFKCECGSKECRGIITGIDWKMKKLQKKYGKYFASYLQEQF